MGLCCFFSVMVAFYTCTDISLGLIREISPKRYIKYEFKSLNTVVIISVFWFLISLEITRVQASLNYKTACQAAVQLIFSL